MGNPYRFPYCVKENHDYQYDRDDEPIILDDGFEMVRKEMTSIPIIGQVAAGQPILAEQNIDGYFPLPTDYLPSNAGASDSYVLRVKGTSMINIGIMDGDFVFIDAGTTTEYMIPHIHVRDAVFVTNGMTHAKLLSKAGYTVYVLGGEFKELTEAIVGEEAVRSLEKYHFTKGFFGVNGVDIESGYTTPEVKESLLKETAMKRTQTAYVLADDSKLGQIAAISFGQFDKAYVITNKAPEGFVNYKNVMEVSKG